MNDDPLGATGQVPRVYDFGRFPSATTRSPTPLPTVC